jgi:hemolysin III
VILDVEIHDAPLQHDQEWANALTHAIAAAVTLLIGSYMIAVAWAKDSGLGIACAAYVASAFGTFLFSTLSHMILRQPALNTLRAWDQAMIYAMISGTYTPIVYAYADDRLKAILLVMIWIAAIVGFLHKVAWRHRVNSIGTISYLALGWLPAVPLVGRTPAMLAWAMLAGGVVYTIGVIFLMNDRKIRYLHAAWHLCVMLAAFLHFAGIMRYVVDAI